MMFLRVRGASVWKVYLQINVAGEYNEVIAVDVRWTALLMLGGVRQVEIHVDTRFLSIVNELYWKFICFRRRGFIKSWYLRWKLKVDDNTS